ncbi:hypothetical protein BN1013_01715 [Candidatus Rubidus massiliensis]|nr:hypothetical protein BN1013_01715 [Candidatus Rubidus massiliensis]
MHYLLNESYQYIAYEVEDLIPYLAEAEKKAGAIVEEIEHIEPLNETIVNFIKRNKKKLFSWNNLNNPEKALSKKIEELTKIKYINEHPNKAKAWLIIVTALKVILAAAFVLAFVSGTALTIFVAAPISLSILIFFASVTIIVGLLATKTIMNIVYSIKDYKKREDTNFDLLKDETRSLLRQLKKDVRKIEKLINKLNTLQIEREDRANYLAKDNQLKLAFLYKLEESSIRSKSNMANSEALITQMGIDN